MKRIQVDPVDVQIVGGALRPPPPTGVGGWLRRTRFRLAAGLAAIEVLAFAFHGVSRLALFALAVALLLLHFTIGRRIPSYAIRQLTWTLAFAQALVAIFWLVLGVTVFLIGIVLVLAIVIGLAMLLGDRR